MLPEGKFVSTENICWECLKTWTHKQYIHAKDTLKNTYCLCFCVCIRTPQRRCHWVCGWRRWSSIWRTQDSSSMTWRLVFFSFFVNSFGEIYNSAGFHFVLLTTWSRNLYLRNHAFLPPKKISLLIHLLLTAHFISYFFAIIIRLFPVIWKIAVRAYPLV